jgi:hypothetical protein
VAVAVRHNGLSTVTRVLSSLCVVVEAVVAEQVEHSAGGGGGGGGLPLKGGSATSSLHSYLSAVSSLCGVLGTMAVHPSCRKVMAERGLKEVSQI